MADKDFVVKNGLVVNTSLIYANSSLSRVGIGNSSPDATLTVTGTANVQGAVAFTSTLGVTGAATLANTLATTGAVTFSNTLSVTGTLGVTAAATLSNTLAVTGAATLSNTLAVTNSVTFSNTLSVTGAATFGVATFGTSANVGANVQISTTQMLIGNTSSNITINSTAVAVGNSIATSILNATSFSGSANNTNFVGAVFAANVVSNAQLTANLAGYPLLSGGLFTGSVNATAYTTGTYGNTTTGGYSVNVTSIALGNSSVNVAINSTSFTGTANNTLFVGTVSAANVVSNAQLSANLSSYQTTAGLSSNVALLSSNNSSFLGGIAAASYVNTAGAYTISGIHTYTGNTIFSGNVNISGNSFFTTSTTFTGNVFISNTINANGSVGTAGYALVSGGPGTNVYWSPAASSNTAASGAVQFNAAGVLGGSAGFVFSSSTNTLTVGVATINSTNFSQTSNNSLYLGGVLASGYVTTAGPSAVTGNVTFTGNTLINTPTLYANGSTGTAGFVLTSGGGSANAHWAAITINQALQYTFTNAISFANTTSLNEAFEKITVDTTTTGTTYTITPSTDGAVKYFSNTTGPTGAFTLNLVTTNGTLPTGQSLTVSVLVTTGAITTGYCSVFQVDSVSQTIKWQGGSGPVSSSTVGSIDAYTFTALKTATSTFVVLGSVTRFA